MILKTVLISNMHVRIILCSDNTERIFILYEVLITLQSANNKQLHIT